MVHTYTCAQVRAITLEHVADIRRKIADLKALERAMTSIAAECSGNKVPDCPIIDALFRERPLASKGRVTHRARRAAVE
jgi:MerR family mercuric resistance operon transcriptional regulator